ncbi:Orf V, partial [Mucuna pruriens]
MPRLVINYKPLNQDLKWIRYPIPNKKDLLNRLNSVKIFSKFDMKSGFWQIQIKESDRYKTAFTVPFGQYEWNVMPFGLKNAPSEFQKIMNEIFNDYTKFTIVYIDDLKKNPPPWSDIHTQVVKDIKLKVQSIKCLYLPIPEAFKIVEIDASDIGYGVSTQEDVIAYTSKHWNSAQQNYSTVKKEILAIVLCVSKFQSDLLNKKFIIRVDCKSAKDILQKDVKNLASKQIFARALQTFSLTILPGNFYRKKKVMPPKASTSSSRGGRGRGKGFKLDLPEPSLKKGSTTSSLGSFTQPGSSTQKAKQQEESSTQVVVKSKSSTHNPSKPQTSKQTKADYAFLIETLLALQECGLSKLPKKTWADIASESDDESEIDLKALIQKVRDSKVVCNTQKEKQILISTPLTNEAPNTYIYKNKFSNVLHMQPEFWDKNPYKLKTKQGFFYEFVLIDSNSVSIKYFKDPKNPLLNTHSTIQILKVLQPRHFGTNLNEYKKFSQPFDPIGYTYWNYIDAWTKVFWHQNINNKHSWLIYFKTNTKYNFPNWFISWWSQFGPIPEIFPEQVQQRFAQFTKLYNFEESQIPVDLKYFSNFALEWIFSWQYRYNKTESNKYFPTLQRHFFVKWWNQFDASKVESDKKSQLAALLAGFKSKEHLTKNLKEILKMLYSQEEAESSSKTEEANSLATTSSDAFYQNEDDCFGINLNEN